MNYKFSIIWHDYQIDRVEWRCTLANHPDIAGKFAITKADPLAKPTDPEIERLINSGVKVVLMDRKWNHMRKHRIKGVEFIGGKNGYRNIEVIGNRIYHTWYGFDGDGLSVPGKYAAAPWDKLFLKHCRKTLQPKSYRAVTPDGLLGLFDMIQYIESVSDKPLDEMMAVEIGTYQGAAADCFASVFKLLCTVDPWIRKGREMVDVKAVWEETMAEHKNVYHYQETGDEAAGYFPYSFFDFIYIDACHDYDSVKNDIKVWLPKLKDTGFLCGHDYPGRGEGVKRAVDEKFGGPDMVFPDSSWVIQFKKGERI